MKKLTSVAAICAAITLLLSGCNDDDNGVGSGTGGGGGGTTTTSYLGSDATIAAWAVPSTLAFTGPDLGTYGGARTFQRGNVDPLTGADLGQPAGVEIWEGSDGHVDITDLTSTTAPVTNFISTEAGSTVDTLCTSTGTDGGAPNFDYAGVYLAPDLASPTNTTYVYRLPGADGVCGTSDDVIHAVKTGMSLSTTPIISGLMPSATIYTSSGSIQGFVAKSGSTLVMEDSNLANPVTLTTYPGPVVVASPLPNGLVTGFATGRLFDVDGNIVFIDYVAGSVSASLFSIPNWTQANDHIVTAASPTTLYFSVATPASGQTPASTTIYSMPTDGSATPTALSTFLGTVNQMEIAVGGTNLVVGVTTDISYTIQAYPLAGGASVPLYLSAGQNNGRFETTANDVYWNSWVESSSAGSTVRTGTSSGINDMTGAAVLAAVPDSIFMVGGLTDAFAAGDTTTQRLPFTTLFQAQNLTPMTTTLPGGDTITQDGISGASLYAIDATANAVPSTPLGQFPTTTATNLTAGTVRGIEGSVFLEVTNPNGTQDPLTRDLYLVDVDNAPSLTRVTNNL